MSELPFADMWVQVCARCGDTGYEDSGAYCRDCEGDPQWDGPKARHGFLVPGSFDEAVERAAPVLARAYLAMDRMGFPGPEYHEITKRVLRAALGEAT